MKRIDFKTWIIPILIGMVIFYVVLRIPKLGTIVLKTIPTPPNTMNA